MSGSAAYITFTVLSVLASGVVAGAVGRVVFTEGTLSFKVGRVLVFLLCLGFCNGVVRPQLETRNNDQIFEEVVAESPFLAAIREKDPEVFVRYQQLIESALARGASPAEASIQAKQLIMNTMLRRLPNASNDAVNAYIKVLIDAIDELNAVSAPACAGFLFPGMTSTNPSSYLPEAISDRIQEVSAMVILQQETNRAFVGDSVVEQYLREIDVRMSERYGYGLAELEPPANASDYAKTCTVFSHFYREILKEESKISAAIMRYLVYQMSRG